MKMTFLKRKSQGELNAATAEQMLLNVFAACGQEPNSVPLEALASYSNYRKERYAIQRTVIAVVLLLFLLLPVLFMAADVQVVHSNANEAANPVYMVNVSSRVPIRQIHAEIDGRIVPMYETAENEYMLKPRGNGEMHVSVGLLNRQETTTAVNVATVDTDAPQLLSTETDAAFVYFYVSDSGSAVDYAGVTVTDPDGNVRTPTGYDEQAGCIRFAYPDCPLQVRIPDVRGNVLKVELKIA